MKQDTPGEAELAALRLPGFEHLVSGPLGSRLADGIPTARARLALYEQFTGRETSADTRLRALLADASCPPDTARAARSLQRLGAAFEPAFATTPIDWAAEQPPAALDAAGIRERTAIAFGRIVADGREPAGGWPEDYRPGDWDEQKDIVSQAQNALLALLGEARLEDLVEAIDLSVWVPMILLMHGDQRGVLGIVDATRAAHARHGIRALEPFLDYLEGVAQVGLLDLDAAAAPLQRAVDGFSKSPDRRWWMLAKAVQAFSATLTQSSLPEGMEELERSLIEGKWRNGRRSLGHATLMLLAVALASSGDLEAARRLAVADGGLNELSVPATDRIFLLEIMLYSALAEEDEAEAQRLLDLADRMMASPLVVSVRSRMHATAESARSGLPPAHAPDAQADPSLEDLRTRWMILAQTVAHGSREQAWSALAEFDAFTHRAQTAARRKHAIRLFHARTVGHEAPQIPPRLLEVAALAASGLTNREIAERLFLGIRTVEGYVREVLLLFGLSRRSELAHVQLPLDLRRNRQEETPDRVNLSLRQAQVGALIAAGATNAEIADALGITEKTVDKHILAVKTRIGAHTRTEIAAAFA